MKKYHVYIWLAVCLLLLNGELYSQFAGSIECQCLSNQTAPGNGQFKDKVIVKSESGETWSVLEIEGLYKLSSQAPPADPEIIEVGTQLSEIGIGSYFLDGIRKEHTDWRIVVTNGTSVLEVFSRHECSYNNPVILSDDIYCITDEKNISFTTPIDLYSNVMWTVDNGTILENNIEDITVRWNENTGSANIFLSVDVMPSEFGNGTACHFDVEKEIELTDDPNICAFLLPVELTYFKATPTNYGTELNWSSSSESNIDFYEVQFSYDGHVWEGISEVRGTNTLNIVEYNTTHYSKLTRTTYYRLRVVEYDGIVAYSDIVQVSPRRDEESDIRIYPNPSTGIFKVDVKTDTDIESLTLESIDRSISVKLYSNYEELDLSRYENGIYNLYIVTDKGLLTKKLIKL